MPSCQFLGMSKLSDDHVALIFGCFYSLLSRMIHFYPLNLPMCQLGVRNVGWSGPGYTYYQRGEQKKIEQTLRRGRRLSIIGFFQPLISFVYGLVIGGVGRKSYIQMMEKEAEESAALGRIRVIVQDNGPIHRCLEVQQLWSKWESQGLYIFFLPKYCSEMNPIELEWQHIKKNELAGKMFEDELELAYAVIHGVEVRAERGNHTAQRVKFNSNPVT